jgi:hypothetical protein
MYAFLQQINAKIVHPPEDGPWAPGYYSVLFEDPDGIRLEVNYVPGKGNLDPSIDLPRIGLNYFGRRRDRPSLGQNPRAISMIWCTL